MQGRKEAAEQRERLQEMRATVRPSRVQHPATGAFVEVGCVRVWDASQIYGVAMSRSLGDAQVHPFIIPVPDITSRTLDERDRLLVLVDVLVHRRQVVAVRGEAIAHECRLPRALDAKVNRPELA